MPDTMTIQTSSANPDDSAHRVAIARAVHQLLDEPKVLDDPLSMCLLGPELGKAVSADPFVYNDSSTRSMRAGIVARTLLSEDTLSAAVARGVRQVVSLGAGLDTYALRYGANIPHVNLYEVDQPAMLKLKQDRMEQAGLTIPGNMQFVAADLIRECWLEALAGSGFDGTQPVAISWMGVSPYLTPEQVCNVLASVASLAPGSVIVFDYRVATNLLSPIEQSIVAVSEQMFAAMGEPWLSQFHPETLMNKLHEMGFVQVDNSDANSLNQRYFHRRKDGLQIAGGGFNYITALR